MTSNPYAPKSDVENSTGISDSAYSPRRPLPDAIVFAALACAFCGLLYSWGWSVILFLLEATAVPPLVGMGNFGQFGFAIISCGIAGALSGLTFALIAYKSFFTWAVVYGIMLYFMTPAWVTHLPPDHVAALSYSIVTLLTITVAAIANTFYAPHRRHRSSVNSRESGLRRSAKDAPAHSRSG